MLHCLCCCAAAETDPALLLLLLRRARCTDEDAAAVRSLAGIIGCLSRMHILTPVGSAGARGAAQPAGPTAADGAVSGGTAVPAGVVEHNTTLSLHAGGAKATATEAALTTAASAVAAAVGLSDDPEVLQQLPPLLCVSPLAADTICSVATVQGCRAAKAGVQVYTQLQKQAVLLVQHTAAALPLALLEGRAGGQEIGLIWSVFGFVAAAGFVHWLLVSCCCCCFSGSCGNSATSVTFVYVCEGSSSLRRCFCGSVVLCLCSEGLAAARIRNSQLERYLLLCVHSAACLCPFHFSMTLAAATVVAPTLTIDAASRAHKFDYMCRTSFLCLLWRCCCLRWLCPSLSDTMSVESDPFAREFGPSRQQQQQQEALVSLNAQHLLSVLKWMAPLRAEASQQQQLQKQQQARKPPPKASVPEPAVVGTAERSSNTNAVDLQPFVWLSAWRQLVLRLLGYLPLLQVQQRLALLQAAAAADDDLAWRVSLG